MVTALAYFVAVGLFASFLKTIVSMFLAAVQGLLQPIRDVFRPKRWIPSAGVRESLAETWRDNIAKVPANLMLAAGQAARLTAAAVVGAVAVAATVPFVLRDTKVDRYVWVATAQPVATTQPVGGATPQEPGGEQEADTQEVEAEEGEPPAKPQEAAPPETGTQQQGTSPPPGTPPQPDAPPEMGTPPGTSPQPDKPPKTGTPPSGTPQLPGTPPQPDTPSQTNTQLVLEAHMRNGTVFSVTHLNDAQPKTGEGICLNASQQAWLREFRNAIAACVNAEAGSGAGIRRFDVTAFASVAPVDSSGFTSAELNCEIANRRADAVGAFLVDETGHKSKWDCDSVATDFGAAKEFCVASASEDPFQDYAGTHNGAAFEVRVHRWSSPREMEDRKPVDDGALPDDRRYDAEMFNRSVHISVPRGFCRPSESKQTVRQPAASTTADAQMPEETSNVRE